MLKEFQKAINLVF